MKRKRREGEREEGKREVSRGREKEKKRIERISMLNGGLLGDEYQQEGGW
jgi:hypothetical protein